MYPQMPHDMNAESPIIDMILLSGAARLDLDGAWLMKGSLL